MWSRLMDSLGLMDSWGYGGYGPFHTVVWIILAVAAAAGIGWRLRSGSW